ncbi:hypothetical protein IAQ61_000375 [Plenodomus lingam]|uniref:uncharacterized protein n=1 Tax=Leptosphaeria maculans TaxID=5022 RepID=UPI0033210F1B|nr:hypothetical protein IAQ61_000375 [Plenodomus lingam]
MFLECPQSLIRSPSLGLRRSNAATANHRRWRCASTARGGNQEPAANHQASPWGVETENVVQKLFLG